MPTVVANNRLESLHRCPLCRSEQRKLRFQGLTDQLYGSIGEWNFWDCRACGSAYLDPRLTPEAIHTAYDHYFTHEVPRTTSKTATFASAIKNDYLAWQYGYDVPFRKKYGRYFMMLLPRFLRNEWDRYARHLPKPEIGSDRLLDVGCGNGEFLLRARKAGWIVEGCDPDSKAVRLGRQRGLEIKIGDPRIYAEGSFDVVTLNHVVEHVHDPVSFLAECLRILKPGGILWLATPNLSSLPVFLFGRRSYCLQPPAHMILFCKQSLTRALNMVGAEQVDLKRQGYHLAYTLPKYRHFAAGLPAETLLDARVGAASIPLILIMELVISFLPQLQEELVVMARKP